MQYNVMQRMNERTNNRMTVMQCRRNLHLGLSKNDGGISVSLCVWALALIFFALSLSLSFASTQWIYIKRNISKILFNQYLRTAFVHVYIYMQTYSAFHLDVGREVKVEALRRLKCKISICKSISINWLKINSCRAISCAIAIAF